MVLACAQSARTPAEPLVDQPALRVMSYNVNYGVAGDRPTLDAIRRGQADIVFLQETNVAWERQLRELEDVYPHMIFHHAQGAGGYAFLSKFPFEHRSIEAHPESWFPAGYAVFETPIGKVQGLNVHLRPPFSDGGSIVAGYFTTPATRQAEIEHFTKDVAADMPLIVAGDFNEDASGGAVRLLEARGLASAVEAFRPGADTWRWNTSVGTISSQLDHVLHSPELQPLNADVRDQGNSDHLPVVATFVAAM
jgi:endonuclease/exonuclease/phosphatase (EEP) superfamily protein YafD